jgi:hypothetical protein
MATAWKLRGSNVGKGNYFSILKRKMALGLVHSNLDKAVPLGVRRPRRQACHLPESKVRGRPVYRILIFVTGSSGLDFGPLADGHVVSWLSYWGGGGRVSGRGASGLLCAHLTRH